MGGGRAFSRARTVTRLAGSHHEVKRHRLIAGSAYVDAVRSCLQQPASALSAEIVRESNVIAISKDLRRGRLDVENQPPRCGHHHRFGGGLARRRRQDRLRHVEHHHRPETERPVSKALPRLGPPRWRLQPILGEWQSDGRERPRVPGNRKTRRWIARRRLAGNAVRTRPLRPRGSRQHQHRDQRRGHHTHYSTFSPRSSINRRNSAAV